MGGLIYPPSGDAFDSWEDDSPSQRAILIRAIRETPKLLERCVVGAKSWSEVIARLTRARDDWRSTIRDEEADGPTHREAAMSLKSIISRIADS